MTLEGTVGKVAQFGALVDLGVHQDGLLHVSQLANTFVNDARAVVKTGDIVKAKVLEVDLVRGRDRCGEGSENGYRPAGRWSPPSRNCRPSAEARSAGGAGLFPLPEEEGVEQRSGASEKAFDLRGGNERPRQVRVALRRTG